MSETCGVAVLNAACEELIYEADKADGEARWHQDLASRATGRAQMARARIAGIDIAIQKLKESE